MGSDDTPAPCSNFYELSMHQTSQFSDSLMDLKNLRKQLFSAADYFESSYDKDDHKQFVVESSKDYVAKALVSTVDHLGSVADKLSKFLDEKFNEFSATKIRFSCIEQRLKTYHGFFESRGRSEQSLLIDAPKHHKHYTSPAGEAFHHGKSAAVWRNCVSCPQNDTYQTDQGNSIAIAFLPARVKPQTPVLRKGHSLRPSYESSPNPLSFSFSKVISKKEAGKRSISPLRFPLKRSESVASRSVSVSPIHSSTKQQRWPSQPRRATLAGMKPEMTNKREIESYTKKSKHLFKALLSVHRSRKDTTHGGLFRDAGL